MNLKLCFGLCYLRFRQHHNFHYHSCQVELSACAGHRDVKEKQEGVSLSPAGL